MIDAPAFNKLIARRRRRSNCSGLPCGLMPEEYTSGSPESITYAQINNGAEPLEHAD